MSQDARIFVQVKSHGRIALNGIIEDLFFQSSFPERIFIALGSKPDASLMKSLHKKGVSDEQLRFFEDHSDKVTSLIASDGDLSSLWRGEEYVLYIDSNCGLDSGWDETLISMIKRCHSRKAVITTNPEFFGGKKSEFSKSDVVAIGVKDITEGIKLTYRGVAKERDKLGDKLPRGAFCDTAFMFSLASVVSEVPFDYEMRGGFENTAMSLRLWTHGWNIFHPDENIVFVRTPQNSYKQPERENTINRFMALLGKAGDDGALEIGRFGLGKQRNLRNFYVVSGINLDTGKVDISAKNADFIFPEKIMGNEAVENIKSKLAVQKLEKPKHKPTVVIENNDIIVIDNFINPEVFENLLIYLGNIPLGLPLEGNIVPNWYNLRDGLPLMGAMSFSFDGKSKAQVKEHKEKKEENKDEVKEESYTNPAILRFAEKINDSSENIENIIGKVGSDWKKFTVENFVYQPGTGKTFNTNQSVNYFPSFEFCLTDNWSFNWGGIILAESESVKKEKRSDLLPDVRENIDCGIWIQPKPNRMIFFSRRCSHSISKVTSNAGDNMISFLSGIFR